MHTLNIHNLKTNKMFKTLQKGNRFDCEDLKNKTTF